MPWFKLDDGFAQHRKVEQCSLAAIGLWVKAASWSMSQLMSGRVPARMLARFGATKKQAQELVDAGLWEVVDDGWLFHDWEDYQPTKDKIIADREAAKKRMQQFRRGEGRAS